MEDKQGLLQPGVTQVCLIEHWTFEYKSYETNRGNPKKTNVHGALFMIAWGLPCLGAQLRPTTVLVWQDRMKSITTMWALATREMTSQKERNTHSWRRALFIVWLNMQGNDFFCTSLPHTKHHLISTVPGPRQTVPSTSIRCQLMNSYIVSTCVQEYTTDAKACRVIE